MESGLVVVDIDPRHSGEESWQKLIDEHGPLPLTPTLRTGSGGRHLYFRHPAQGLRVGNRQNMVPGVDLRGDGGYVIGPGSNHVDGDYLPEPGSYLPDVPLATMPLWLLDLALNKAQPGSTKAADAAVPIEQGQRHPSLLTLAGAMRAKGMSQAGIEAALRAENQTRCTPPLEEKELQKLVRAVMKYPAGQASSSRILSSLPRVERIRETKVAFVATMAAFSPTSAP